MKSLKSLSLILCLAILIYSFYLIFRLMIVASPHELRESAIILNTQLLTNGLNPYSLELMPLYTNVYGILYHLVVAPFAAIFGSTFFLHRFFSFLFVILSTFYFYKLSKSLVASTMLFVQLSFGGYDLLARPDSLGFLLFLLSVFIPRKLKYSYKGILLSILFSILAFMTKPYFVLGMFFVSSYILLFVNKRKGIIAICLSLIALALTILILAVLFDTYVSNAIFTHIQGASSDRTHLHKQIITFILWNFSFIVAGIFLLKNFRKPDLTSYITVVSSILLYFKLGLHSGNFMTYFTHLLLPFFLLAILNNISSLRSKAAILVQILIVINITLWLVKIINNTPNFSHVNSNWHEWEEFLSNYKNTYNSPPLAYILSKQNKPIYDTGQSEFFKDSLKLNNEFEQIIKINNQYYNYVSGIKSQLNLQKFDVVITTNHGFTFFDRVGLEKFYYLAYSKPMIMYKDSYDAQIWLPIQFINKD